MDTYSALSTSQATIEGIFPIPIYISTFGRSFTSKEKTFANSQIDHCLNVPPVLTGGGHSTGGNALTQQTKDNYVLNNKVFSNIKKGIELILKDYTDKVICPKDNFELYITQSWLNYAKKGQSHPHHSHTNSYVSGVLYFNVDQNNKIYFQKSGYRQITPPVKTWKAWNSPTWWLPVEAGSIVLFPSSTVHRVAPQKEENTRISLSFNTFIKGDLGEEITLTKLKL